MRKTIYSLITAAVGMALAILPSSASADPVVVEVEVSGVTYSDCYSANGWYEYEQTGSAGGYPKYRTKTQICVGPWEDCSSWVDDGILQYSGYQYRSGSWRQIEWKRAPQDAWGDYAVNLSDVRDIRFRVCNVTDGDVGGCGRVV
jgi:hypothetical protein